MKTEYDLSKIKSRKNPYASQLKKPATAQLSEVVISCPEEKIIEVDLNKEKNMCNYDIYEHVHRLAVWAASSAANTVKGKRFTVKFGKALIEAAGLKEVLRGGADNLPKPDDMDKAHKKWREAVICKAKESKKDFTHGLAAKLINVYLKVGFVTILGHEHPSVAALHPPIDRVLLDGLAKKDRVKAKQWRGFRDAAWSTYSSDQYEEVICSIRTYLDGKPMWKIEEAWAGHQG